MWWKSIDIKKKHLPSFFEQMLELLVQFSKKFTVANSKLANFFCYELCSKEANRRMCCFFGVNLSTKNFKFAIKIHWHQKKAFAFFFWTNVGTSCSIFETFRVANLKMYNFFLIRIMFQRSKEVPVIFFGRKLST